MTDLSIVEIYQLLEKANLIVVNQTLGHKIDSLKI